MFILVVSYYYARVNRLLWVRLKRPRGRKPNQEIAHQNLEPPKNLTTITNRNITTTLLPPQEARPSFITRAHRLRLQCSAISPSPQPQSKWTPPSNPSSSSKSPVRSAPLSQTYPSHITNRRPRPHRLPRRRHPGARRVHGRHHPRKAPPSAFRSRTGNNEANLTARITSPSSATSKVPCARTTSCACLSPSVRRGG
jgi:hypothetical protein